MIHLKAVFQKSLIKHGIIILTLFVTCLMFWNFSLCINNSFEEKVQSLENRTLVVKLSSNKQYEQVINDFIEELESVEYDLENDSYIIIFNNYNSIEKFLNKNNNFFSEIYKNQVIDNESEIIINHVFKSIVVISIILIIILSIIFSINTIYSLEKDIALYKLLGYSQSSIFVSIAIGIYIVYIMLFLISTLITQLLTIIINLLKYNMINNIKISLVLSFNDYLWIIIIISLAVVVSLIRIMFKITRITPIELIKSY